MSAAKVRTFESDEDLGGTASTELVRACTCATDGVASPYRDERGASHPVPLRDQRRRIELGQEVVPVYLETVS